MLLKRKSLNAMHLADGNDTPGLAILPAVDMERFRKTLREQRKKHVGGRPQLAKRTAASGKKPVHPQTIRDIEAGEIEDPGVLTVARLVEAMGLTLSDFFLQFESQTYADSTTPDKVEQTSASQNRGGGGGADTKVSEPASVERIQALFEDLSVAFGDMAERISARRRKA